MQLNCLNFFHFYLSCFFVLDESDEESTAGERRAKRRRLAEKSAAGIDSVGEDVIESIDNLNDTKGHSPKEWVSMLGPRTEIINR